MFLVLGINSIESPTHMKYYRFTDTVSGADVTVTTGGIDDCQLEPILSVKGIDAAAESIGLNHHVLRQVTVQNTYFADLATSTGCKLTVAQDHETPVQLVADGAYVDGAADEIPAEGGEQPSA